MDMFEYETLVIRIGRNCPFGHEARAVIYINRCLCDELDFVANTRLVAKTRMFRSNEKEIKRSGRSNVTILMTREY